MSHLRGPERSNPAGVGTLQEEALDAIMSDEGEHVFSSSGGS